MKLIIFSVFDQKAGAYIQPFFSQTVGTALRSFNTAANQQDHDFNRHAADYTLFEFGTYEQSDGKFEILETPISHGSALHQVAVKPATWPNEGNSVSADLLEQRHTGAQ